MKRQADKSLAGGDARPHWTCAASGFILGVLLWVASSELLLRALLVTSWDRLLPVAGVAGALVAMTRARPALWVTGAVVSAGLGVVCYTPLVSALVRGAFEADRLQRVEAVVVLSANIWDDGTPSSVSQGRLLRGYELLRAGYARELVLTRLAPPRPSYEPAVRRQLLALGIEVPVHEVGPVWNTRDEAGAVRQLALDRGWSQVILVTDPMHMRRAAAAFEKSGVRVLRAPSAEGDYDLGSLRGPSDRLQAFRDWAHEAVGYQSYRLRGWI